MTNSIKSKIVLTCLALVFLPLIVFSQNATPWTVPADAQAVKNPITASPDILVVSETLFTSKCIRCHGAKGKGDGVAASGLSTKPADLSSVRVQGQSDGAIYYKINTGRNEMAVYSKTFTDVQKWSLVHYIRTLKN